jgi:hypothetical protein
MEISRQQLPKSLDHSLVFPTVTDDEVKVGCDVARRCRSALQAQTDALMATANQLFAQTNHVDLTLALV